MAQRVKNVVYNETELIVNCRTCYTVSEAVFQYVQFVDHGVTQQINKTSVTNPTTCLYKIQQRLFKKQLSVGQQHTKSLWEMLFTNADDIETRIYWTFSAVRLRDSSSQQVLSSGWDGRQFGHNRHGPKSGGCCAPFWEGGSPSNTVSPGPRPTSIPSGWHLDQSNRLATIHQRYRQDSGPIA